MNRHENSAFLKILDVQQIVEAYHQQPVHFIRFWQRGYQGPSRQGYIDNLRLMDDLIEPANLRSLYQWKEGREFDKFRETTKHSCQEVEKLASVFRDVRHGRVKISLLQRDLEDCYATDAPVMKAFWVHVAQSFRYAMIDQHTHRAYLWLQRRELHLKSLSGRAFDKHWEEYQDFFWRLAQSAEIESQDINALKDVDDALMALGQFIKTNAWVFQD